MTFSTECNHEHNDVINLDQVMDAIKDAMSSANVSADELQCLQYEFDIARSDVEAWKAHILRTYNQESAKHDILDVLSMIKNQNPNITDAYLNLLKRDNAGCYHNSQLLLALPDISRRTGILYNAMILNQGRTYVIEKFLQ